ncbi:centrosome-associated protein 350 isoform X2 [Austrofundulus limnaeus]|uniref:Centrosome-associated protein 350 isoform X2 n=1 Tax=Austrofundulus limnaeus TaxID=52670 RepID=A0A2I4AL79_AUSLI|nr:PREDICTED: centrosome-associated protein 350 isoform X2 [Austrofundulus limnaeus]
MGEMRSSRRTEASLKSSAQLFTDHNIAPELTAAWKGLTQSKAALRHIENCLEATPGTGVLLDSVSEAPKKKSSKRVRHKDGQVDVLEGTSKPTGGNQQSPAKSSSRSPLRNTTQDSNVRKNSSVEFREPLASYREATPPSRPFSQLEAYNLQSVPGSSYTSSPPQSDPLPSQMVYQRDTRDRQTDRDLDSTRSSALESAEVRFLNDQSALDILKTEGNAHKAQLSMDESSPCTAPTPGSSRRGESTPSTSPGSASQRLENLKRHQPDDKLEKLKARIRRQRKHLEEAAEREKLQGQLEKPKAAFVESESDGVTTMPTAKIRKVTTGPPAPIYKGFNSTETKIQTPDGKVWNEKDFHNLSRELYRDTHHCPESTGSKHQQQRERRAERSSEKRPSKPVRKVQKVPLVSDLNSKPAISPASWREGQKLVKMVLGPGPGLPREEHSSHPAGRQTRADSHHRSKLQSEPNRSSRPNSTERLRSGSKERPTSHSSATYRPSSAAQEKTQLRVSTDLLSADIQGILDDLQLDREVAEKDERARKRSRGGSVSRRGRGGSGSQTRTPVSTWGTSAAANTSSRGCRSASPTARQSDTINTSDKGHKRRHYDADTVRQYIARQQEERKRRQAEEKREMKEEAERRYQRLQELYRKQREVAKTVPPSAEALMAPVQKRLQETYTKLLQEDAQLNEEATQRLPLPSSQMRPVYQPSGESDKENKRQEVPQSPSSSDKSLTDPPPPPLSRNDLDVDVNSWLQPDRLRPAVQPTFGPSSSTQAPSNEHLLSQLLRLEAAVAASNIKFSERPATAPYSRSQTKMSRIEAIKATATSLSNRIELEARKFAGQEINYGAATSVDVDTILAPRPNLDQCWTEAVNYATNNDDTTHRMYTVPASTGHSSFSGTALPGAGNLHDLREKKEKSHTGFTNPHTSPADVNVPAYNGFAQERSRIVCGLEKKERTENQPMTKAHKEDGQADFHDSSAGSISEGPILSEGSFSEDEASPRPCSDNHVPLSDLLEAKDYCASQRKNKQRLLEFQREAAMCSPFLQLDSSKPPWEELNKGSPLSVINIFTKNVHSHVKASERNSERNSPHANSPHSGNSPCSAAVYEDDFVSSQSSKTSDQRGSNSPSRSQHLSSGSTPGSSPHSRHSARKKGTASDQSDATLVEEQRSSPPSEALFSNGKKRRSDKSPSPTQAKSVHSNDTSGEASGHSSQRHNLASPSGFPHSSSPGADSLSEPLRSGAFGVNIPNISTSVYNGGAESRPTGELQYSPAVLQQRMSAELQYLESIEESIKQMGDIERLMGVSVAQQESASLAQMLKAKQQHHERELYELKIKAEREAFETKLQLEENRQRVARAHLELQESLAASQKESLEGLQESTSKMMSQQAEAARHTAEAARHIKEMTELARSQIAGTLIIPAVNTDYALMDQRKEHRNSKPQEDKADSDSEFSSRRTRSEEHGQSDSLSYKRPDHSVSASTSSHYSQSHVSSGPREQPNKEASAGKQGSGVAKKRLEMEEASSSIEEDLPSAANGSLCSESIPSVVDEKDTTSVATEYSLKMEESMTEDEIEERSFRSLLPSEAHRRGTMEKKSRHNQEADDDRASHNAASVSETGSHSTFKSYNAHIAFSGGQDSFSQFTMEMVRQYMKDEEVRLQHQSSLLHLRQKALKEKTRAELAWLEHQRKKLRDKGEDDKMPPIRKKQRGLLIKLQQEQAEIRRLQEANKAARKERQLLLKQQEEIERMRNSTLRLKERLKSAGGQTPPETPASELPESEPASPNSTMFKDDIRSPSPSLSISGSETSSIMQKLKKMRSHMDEKFLTKREQQLMQRRRHAEELLQWKQQLDQEEAEVRRMEKEAMAVWKQKRARDKPHERPESPGKEITETGSHTGHHQSFEATSDSEKVYFSDHISEGNCSSVTSESTIHTEGAGSHHEGRPSPAKPDSVSETPLALVQSSPASYTQDFSSESQPPSREPSLLKASHSPAASPAEGSSKSKMQLHPASWTQSEVITQPLDSPTATQSENISDQSDIEGRIKALKEELRKRKLMAYQLKKEQKKRHKERLKAQEASLLKQLENYDSFIEKTKAELNKELDSTPDSKLVLEQSSIKSPPHRSETNKGPDSERSLSDASFEHNAFPQAKNTRSTSNASHEDLSNKEASTSRVPVHSRAESETLEQEMPAESPFQLAEIKHVTDQRSDIEEELEVEERFKSEDEHSHHLLKLEKENRLDSQETMTKHVSSILDEEHQRSASVRPEHDTQMKHNLISNVEEAVISKGSGEPHSAAAELETSPHGSCTFSANDYSHSPDSALSSKKKPSIKDSGTSPVADSYYDDFESTRSSPREDNAFKPESQVSSSHTEIKHSSKDSSSREPTLDIQEEVEMSRQSGVSEESHQSERLLHLNQQREDVQHDNKGTHSPPQTPPPSLKDEMPSFGLGDRVLVGGVQPGTLRFKGPTSFANGFWAGVELDKSEGSNNGTYDGVVYFNCEECHGIFAPPDKITHLPDKYDLDADTTEDEDSFYDDLFDKGGSKPKKIQDNSQNQGDLESKNEDTFLKEKESGDAEVMGETNQAPLEEKPPLNSQHHKESTLLVSNGKTEDIILDLEDASHTSLILDVDKSGLVNKETTAIIERNDADSKEHLSPHGLATDIKDESEPKDRDLLDTFTDTLIKNFVRDAVEQLAEIKKSKEEKIKTANQLNGDLFGENNEEDIWISSIQQKDGLPFFLPSEKEELSSPELCNRPESPMLGASGQEELVKRLAELELSRELVDEFGDDQDWFDEDFGLSSRRKQQRIKQNEEEAKLGGELGRSGSSSGPLMGEIISSLGGESQVKIPPRPELPLPLPPKLPEQPAMVVPHSAREVEKMVHAATLEIWESCELGREGALALEQPPKPTPSVEYLGKESSSQDQESISIRSYRKAVYDLTWEILQEIYTQDPDTDQPQWVKPRQVKSSSIHKVKTAGDINKIQEFVTAEILKLYNLTQDQNQKSDWQKMLKFGRKKRDRVDHILVQELHEEEAQWVNYDEDELFVKLQLADSIFDALLKDTADAFTLISAKRAKRGLLS